MTQLSLPALQAVLAQESGEVFLACLTITHAMLAAPIRLVDDTKDLIRAAGTFSAFSFAITVPPQQDDKLPSVKLTVDNVDRSIAVALRSISSPASVSLEIVLASSPDTVEQGPFALTLRNAQIVADAVVCDLMFEDLLNEPFPKNYFTPVDFPGLFQ
jgi:hypothetical protein